MDEARIHPSAVIHRGAELGPGVEVGPFCVIESGVMVADGCHLAPNVHLLGRARIGAGTRIGSGTVIGGEPQDKGYRGEATGVVIGSDCRIHEHLTVSRATGEGETVIGDGVMLMAGSHVGHNAVVEDQVVLVNCAAVAGHAHVGAHALLSAYSALHQFGRVGRLTLVGGACMLTRDAPPFSIVVGAYPPRWRGPNTEGLRRAGFSSEVRSEIRRALFAIFKGDGGSLAAAEGLLESPRPEVVELARFVLDCPREICAGPRGS